MINTFVGNMGHLMVIISFVSSLFAALAYFLAVQYRNQESISRSWKKFARLNFLIHGIAVAGTVSAMFYILFNHHFEYHYAWNYSSRNLSTEFLVSCFWHGQEGSFLLWIIWNAILGFILIFTNRFWEASVMSIFSLVQAFLTSMIIGAVFLEIKFGSNPFILLRDALPNIPVFQPDNAQMYNPNFVPEDGTGLNPLLQNYWMVIHPPTLFLGYATTLIPFAYCLAGLWLGKFRDWVRPALPWALFSGAILGLGILMGGYWAYETLNFGGYWNWDPVENAVYVPWLVLVASIHTMIAFRKNNTALKAAMILCISTFILILYATFLTRSGILGNASVHSFTDLGLSGQLLWYLWSFILLSVVLLIWRWKQIPTSKKEISTYSREFWIFMGATVLCLAAFQVIVTTSIPVYNSIIESFGFISNMALPADQIEHYTKFQLWAAIFIALLSGTGQFFWWQKMDRESLLKAMTIPLVISLLSSSLVIMLYPVRHMTFIVLLTASVYSLVANFSILLSLFLKSNFKLAGGSIAHIGVALMLLGVMFSSGYSRVISKNMTGRIYSSELPDEMNEDNVLLWYNRPVLMNDYQVTYRGPRVKVKDVPGYVNKSSLVPTKDPFKMIARNDLVYREKAYFEAGDTVGLNPENTYYHVEYRKNNGRIFNLYPRVQVNPQMGFVASPDIHRSGPQDLYTHATMVLDPNKERDWSQAKEYTIRLKDTLYLNDYVAILDGVNKIDQEGLIQLASNEAGVKAEMRIMGPQGSYLMEPTFLVSPNRGVAQIPDVNEQLGLRINLLSIDPENGTFTFSVNTTQRDYIILKAVEKPFINVLWIGTLVLMLGFGIAIYRRYDEFAKMRNKGME